MKLRDYSPSSHPSLKEQHDALRKGLGRAQQWALLGRLNDEPLLTACLTDQRYDTQIEDSRGDWLWRMIQAVNAVKRFRASIFQAVSELSDDQSAHQLCELARCYAQMGDHDFRTRLYEIVERKPIPEVPWLAHAEIFALDGIQALLYVARVRGQELTIRTWDWDDDNFIENATEHFGGNLVSQVLANSSDEAIIRFHSIWQQIKQTKEKEKPKLSHKERMRAVPVTDINSAAASDIPQFGLFRSWGMYADPIDLEMVLKQLWVTREPKIMANLLCVFSNRALPQFDERLIELCQHSEANVRLRAFNALAQNTHPKVRQFALAQLQKGLCEGFVCKLFCKNFTQGDEQLILEAIELPSDEIELHTLLYDLNQVMDENPEADASRLGVITYAETPCENCRFVALRRLHQQRVVPQWMREECPHDSGEDCRKFAATCMDSLAVDRIS